MTRRNYNALFALVLAVPLVVGSLGTGPSLAAAPGDLLLDAKARSQFASTYLPSSVVVHYYPPLAEGEDASLRSKRQVRAVVVDDGGLQVLAPLDYLRGATAVEIERHDGKRVSARVQWPTKNADEIPLVRLWPAKAGGFKGLVGVKWAKPKRVVEGLRVWGVELSSTIMPDGKRAEVLLDAVVGKRVEYPLERFFYVGLGRVDGQALLTAEGTLACVVYRTVPGTRNVGLCAPQDAALKLPKRKEPAVKKLKLTTVK